MNRLRQNKLIGHFSFTSASVSKSYDVFVMARALFPTSNCGRVSLQSVKLALTSSVSIGQKSTTGVSTTVTTAVSYAGVNQSAVNVANSNTNAGANGVLLVDSTKGLATSFDIAPDQRLVLSPDLSDTITVILSVYES